MKKSNFFITSEATKYWKKEVKNGHLRIATEGDKIYIVNGFNAFVIPNMPILFEELVQPATLRPAPEDGRAQIWQGGNFREDAAADTVNIVKRIIESDTVPVARTPFTYEIKHGDTLRVYKLQSGKLAGINAKYDCMVDFNFKHVASMANPKAPAVFTSEHFTAILMPVNVTNLPDAVQALAENI